MRKWKKDRKKGRRGKHKGGICKTTIKKESTASIVQCFTYMHAHTDTQTVSNALKYTLKYRAGTSYELDQCKPESSFRG